MYLYLYFSFKFHIFAVKYVCLCNKRRLIPTPGPLTDAYLNISRFVAENLHSAAQMMRDNIQNFIRPAKNLVIKQI